MLRKLIVVIAVMTLVITGLSCKKKPSENDANEIKIKTQAEYDVQAKQEIDSNNMKAELEKIEEQLKQETGGRI